MQYEEKKGIQIRMGEIKLFAEDMLITVEIPNEPTKNPYVFLFPSMYDAHTWIILMFKEI